MTDRAKFPALRAAFAFFAAAPASVTLAGGRVLTTSDVVTITIPGEPSLDTTARIEPDGTLAYPYVGRVKAAGLTQDQLARAIEKRLIELKILLPP
jgi:polysaccharide export outer membrane protein